MKLYHGTAERNLSSIRKHGLQPRKGTKRKSNWKGNPSHPDAVYLTNSYAVFYANAAARDSKKLIVLEIDTDKLNPFAFAPDEDFLEQALRGRDGIPGDMYKRTVTYKKRLHLYCEDITDPASPPAVSLEHLGNCTYHGSISVSAITRVAVIDIKLAQQFVFKYFDPSIVLMNYKVCGPKYRNSLKWLFGYDLEEDPLNTLEATAGPTMQGIVERPPLTRDGITIEEMGG